MRKIISLMLVFLAYLIYFKDGNIIKAKDISIGQRSTIIKVITIDGVREVITYYPMDQIDHIEEVKW